MHKTDGRYPRVGTQRMFSQVQPLPRNIREACRPVCDTPDVDQPLVTSEIRCRFLLLAISSFLRARGIPLLSPRPSFCLVFLVSSASPPFVFLFISLHPVRYSFLTIWK